jgi:hypothetical protein
MELVSYAQIMKNVHLIHDGLETFIRIRYVTCLKITFQRATGVF